jgi:hypothetical protein
LFGRHFAGEVSVGCLDVRFVFAGPGFGDPLLQNAAPVVARILSGYSLNIIAADGIPLRRELVADDLIDKLITALAK